MDRVNWEMILAGPKDLATSEISGCRDAATLRTLVRSGLLLADGRRDAATARVRELEASAQAGPP